MSAKQIQKQVSKPAAKTSDKAASKKAPAAASPALAALAQAVSGKAPVVDAKAQRAAERAKRYPQEAAKEAAKKAAEAKPKTDAPAKAVAPQAKIDNRVRKPGQTTYALSEAARPSNGRALFSHTRAALTMLGMLGDERKPVAVGALITMLGQRAVKHHTAERNFSDAPSGGIRLSPEGLIKFRTRPVDGNLTNAYLNLMLTGDVGTTGAKKEQVFQAKFD